MKGRKNGRKIAVGIITLMILAVLAVYGIALYHGKPHYYRETLNESMYS